MIGPFQAMQMLGETEYNRRIREERRAPPPGGTLLVGERANNDGAPGPEDPRYCIHRGAFLWGPSRDRMTELGLHWHAAMNLLHAQPTGRAEWGADAKAQAQRVAAATLALARERRWRLVLAGSRVAWAFGVTYEPLAIGELEGVELCVIPHPSGRALWWNTAENRAAARELFRRMREEPWASLG